MCAGRPVSLGVFDVSPLHQDAMQQRMAVQEDSVLQLKQELLRCSMAREQLEGENVSYSCHCGLVL